MTTVVRSFIDSVGPSRATPRQSHRKVGPATTRFMLAGFWLAAGVIGIQMGGLFGTSTTMHMLSALTLLFGMWAFFTHGGPQITAAGLTCAATAIFVGYAGWWWSSVLNASIPVEYSVAVIASYFTVVSTYFLFWWPTRTSMMPSPRDPAGARWAVAFGLVVTLASLGAHTMWEQTRVLTPAAAFMGVVILAVGVTGTVGRFRLISWRTIILGALSLLFVLVIFQGFGRLLVIALTGAVAVAISTRMRTRVIKALAIFGVPAVATILTNLRHQRVGTSAGARSDSDVAGVSTFGRLIAGADRFDPAMGDTYFAAVVAWIPREVWPGKPIGFGSELTLLLERNYAESGHSMVATAFGEWFYNFGWYGLPLFVVTAGPAIRWLDRRRSELVSSSLATPRSLLMFALLLAAISTLADFVWGGTFTYGARMWPRVIVILLFLVPFWNLTFGRARSASASEDRPLMPDPSDR